MANYNVEQYAYIQDHADRLVMDPEAFIAAQQSSGLDMQTFATEQHAAAALLLQQQQALNTPLAPAPQSAPSITDPIAMLTRQNAQQQQAMVRMQTMLT